MAENDVLITFLVAITSLTVTVNERLKSKTTSAKQANFEARLRALERKLLSHKPKGEPKDG